MWWLARLAKALKSCCRMLRAANRFYLVSSVLMRAFNASISASKRRTISSCSSALADN